MYIQEATSWKNIRQNKEYSERNKQIEKNNKTNKNQQRTNYKGEN